MLKKLPENSVCIVIDTAFFDLDKSKKNHIFEIPE